VTLLSLQQLFSVYFLFLEVLAPGPPPLSWRKPHMVDKDLKRLIFENKLRQVTEIKPLPTRTSTSSSALPTAYDSIIATLGFQHHSGSDKHSELTILKLILKRENLINLLQESCALVTRLASL
jgi:hypothetical protein